MSYFFLFFKQKTAYEMRISDWSSDVCSSDLLANAKAKRLIFNDKMLLRSYSRIAQTSGESSAMSTRGLWRRRGGGFSATAEIGCWSHPTRSQIYLALEVFFWGGNPWLGTGGFAPTSRAHDRQDLLPT